MLLIQFICVHRPEKQYFSKEINDVDATAHAANATRQFWGERNFWEKVDDFAPKEH